MTTALIILMAIVASVFFIHLLMGKEMNIERSITIDKPIKQVFDYLKLTKNQDNFSVWNMTDPTMKKEYQGIDGQTGFIYKWDSTNKNVGAGEQEIKKIEKGNCIEYEVRFSRPMKNVGTPKFILDSFGSDKAKITWVFSCPTKFPMTLMKPIFQKMLGRDLEKGLSNLKEVLEK